MFLTALLLALAPAPSVPAPAADPLAPAREGRLQCHTPDAARKSCAALARYEFASDGTIVNRAEVLLDEGSMLVMETETAVVVRDDAVCGLLEGAERATFTAGGQALPIVTTDILRGQLQGVYDQLGREVCTRYVDEGGVLTATVTIDGQPRPDQNQPVLWVAADEGWSVNP